MFARARSPADFRRSAAKPRRDHAVVACELLAIGFVVAFADGSDRQDQLFAAWEQAQRSIRSLVVEFTLETKDSLFGEHQKADGMFRLPRTQKGALFASCKVVEKKAEGDKPGQTSGLLHDGSIYLLNHDSKTAIRFEPESGDVQGFLEKYFNPFVLLLDRKHAAEKCKLEVVKQDEWYTYLAVKPKQVRKYVWFPDTFHEGRAVLMNRPPHQRGCSTPDHHPER